MIKASKGGKTAVFSETVWKSGQPQRYGWINVDQEPVKKLPAEILEFAEIRKKIKEEPKPEIKVESKPEVKPEVKKNEPELKPKPTKKAATEKVKRTRKGAKNDPAK